MEFLELISFNPDGSDNLLVKLNSKKWMLKTVSLR